MTTAALNTPKDHAKHFKNKYGLSVFPLQNPEALTEQEQPDEKKRKVHLENRKRPAVNWDEFQERLATDEEIEQWYNKDPNYNLAFATGAVSQAIGLELDGQSAITIYEQKKTAEMSNDLRRAFENTFIVRSGRGGFHFIFKTTGALLARSITMKRVKLGEKEEIRLKGEGQYFATAPSRHPNGKHYEWNGKDPIRLDYTLVDELVKLFFGGNAESGKNARDSTDSSTSSYKQQQTSPGNGSSSRRLTVAEMKGLLDWIMPIYKDGERDDFLFHFSGMMYKDGGFPIDDAITVVTEISNRSKQPNENLSKNLEIVRRSYSQPLINGKAGLKDLLIDSYGGNNEHERWLRVETFSRICQIINGPPSVNDTTTSTTATSGGGGGEDDDDDNDDNDDKGNEDVNNQNAPGAWLSSMLKSAKNEKREINTVEVLTEEIFRLNHFRTLDDTNEILWYHNGVWEHGGENRIKSLLDKLSRYCVKTHTVNEVLETIRRATLTPRPEFDKDIYLASCRNCIIDLSTGKALEHDPKYLFTQQIPWDYKPNEFKVPWKILHFWYNCMSPATVKDVLEFLGYCLIRNCDLQKAMILAGPPNQGKSKILDLIMALLGGRANVSNKTMHQLNSDRFSRAHLYGKLANICADISDKRLKDIEMFKLLVTGDWIDGEFKGQDSFTFPNKAKLIFSANLPPLPPIESEDDGAFYRRWIPKSVNLRKTCFYHNNNNNNNESRGRKNKVCCFMCSGKVERDPHLIEKLIADEDEMSGLLFLAVQGARFLLANNRFSYNPDTETVREEYLRKAKPVKAWADACCDFSPEYSEGVEKHYIYEHFASYCERRGLPAVEISILGRELAAPEYGVSDAKIGPNKNQKHVWKGIMLRKDLRAKGQLAFDEPDELDDYQY
jgi:phage/plasmid-associated DNA primase